MFIPLITGEHYDNGHRRAKIWALGGKRVLRNKKQALQLEMRL